LAGGHAHRGQPEQQLTPSPGGSTHSSSTWAPSAATIGNVIFSSMQDEDLLVERSAMTAG
jgi:hypothetical protein